MHGQSPGLAARLTLSFFVLVSLCQTPIPWVHRHDGAERIDQLAEHLATYHADGEEESGWHVHFSLVSDILRGNGYPVPPGEDEPDPADVQLNSHSAVVSSWIFGNQQSCASAMVVGDSHNQYVARREKIPSGALHNCALNDGALLISLCVSRC